MVFRGYSHTKIPMMLRFPARCEFRVIKASALAFALMTVACPAAFDAARAQENLFDRIFGGSERVNGAPGEQAVSPSGQERATDRRWIAIAASRAEGASANTAKYSSATVRSAMRA